MRAQNGIPATVKQHITALNELGGLDTLGTPLSDNQVDHHISAILEKLQVRSRTEAVAAAFGLGIVKAAR